MRIQLRVPLLVDEDSMNVESRLRLPMAARLVLRRLLAKHGHEWFEYETDREHTPGRDWSAMPSLINHREFLVRDGWLEVNTTGEL